MKISEAIILAGGLGTRLRGVINELPKAMAPVAGRPFISYVIDYLRMQGIEKFIFSLGYQNEVIINYLQQQYSTLQYECVIEEEPLGTGGAILLSTKKATDQNILVTNGDTLYRIDLDNLISKHTSYDAECTLALKPMKNFSRYGVVDLNEEETISSFKEKQFYSEGLINGGCYLLNVNAFLRHSFPEKFSFETDYLEKHYREKNIYGSIEDAYFIDIGIPEDYERAQKEFASQLLDVSKIASSWSIFIDRDGVVNEERVGEYVQNWEQFKFHHGALEAFKVFNEVFGRIIIVSNQRGVGKGLMTNDDLTDIHNKMQKTIEEAGGRIDKIYYCTEVSDACFFRKPNPGMAVQAKKDFSDINFNKSIMVGNKPGDMKFGRVAGMFTAFLTTTNPQQPFPHPDIDARFSSLIEFANTLKP